MKKIYLAVLCFTILCGNTYSIHAEESAFYDQSENQVLPRDATMDHAVVRSQTFKDIGPHQFIKTIHNTQETVVTLSFPYGLGQITYSLSSKYSYKKYSTKYSYKTIVDYYTSSGYLAYSRTYSGTTSGYYIEML